MNKYWVRWVQDFEKYGDFEVHTPWWFSGYTASGNDIICAAVIGDTEDAAIAYIQDCYDMEVTLDVDFCEFKGTDWSPFNDRFQKADWMKWPE